MTSQDSVVEPATGVDDAVPETTEPAPPGTEPALAGAAPAEPDVAQRLAELTAALTAVQQELRSADERAASRERIIDRLHEENQKLRAGERRLVLMPVLTDLQRLRNDLLRQAATVPPEMAGERVAQLLESYAHSVELTLERGGVAPVRPRTGEPFDGTRHRPTDVVEAPEPAADGRIAAVLADGYEETFSGRVLTPATVRVHRWIEPTEEPHA
ncbi:nucleotide exchange factor GrpE [Nucisporomicrobium flavum]|uniref:nucleotide exchange factor GrpE n=1 Tax=Nucisporomicrobium flavum TaxID=2785915 RepID=UPI0018F51FFF|nr:nucleotide exchange factor GrpE [Nucisporomicrobium flavum]